MRDNIDDIWNRHAVKRVIRYGENKIQRHILLPEAPTHVWVEFRRGGIYSGKYDSLPMVETIRAHLARWGTPLAHIGIYAARILSWGRHAVDYTRTHFYTTGGTNEVRVCCVLRGVVKRKPIAKHDI